MKTLYLVRHAKSSWDHPHLDDIDRPLNNRGKNDAPLMGKRLSKRGIFPDLMITSPAKRAQKTCKHIAKSLEYPASEIVVAEDVYHGSEDILLQVVRECDDLWNSIMIFGHNPGFTDFANSIADAGIDNIPTCGVFACSFDVKNWKDVKFGSGTTLFYDYPKKEFNEA